MILFPLAFSDALFLQFRLQLTRCAGSRNLQSGRLGTSDDHKLRGGVADDGVRDGDRDARRDCAVRGDSRWRGAITAFCYPAHRARAIILAISVYFFLARLGLWSGPFAVLCSPTSAGGAYVVVVVSAALEMVDEELELAAWTLGATRKAAFLRIAFALILPGILAGALFAFLASFDELVVALFISGTTAKTLPKRMWDGIREEIDPTIAAVATLLILLSFALAVAVEVARTRARGLRRAQNPVRN